MAPEGVRLGRVKPIDYDSAGQWPRSLPDAAFSRVSLVAASVCSLLVIAGAGATGHYLKVSPIVVMLVALSALVVSFALLLFSMLGEPRETRSLGLRAWILCLPLCASSSLLIVATVAPINRAFIQLVLTQPDALMLLVSLTFAAMLMSAVGPLLLWLIVHSFLLRRMDAANTSRMHKRSAVVAAITLLLASMFLALYQLAVAIRFPLTHWP